MAKLPDFQKLWDNYPRGSAEEIKKAIGGNVNAAWITNTCAIRLSRSFNYAGFAIPSSLTFADQKRAPLKLNTVKGGDGKRYAFRVAEFLKFLHEKFGKPQIAVRQERGSAMNPKFDGVKGLIVFNDCGWSDATGHVDLWDGREAANHAYWDKAKEVYMWTSDPKWRVVSASRSGGQLSSGSTPIVTISQ